MKNRYSTVIVFAVMAFVSAACSWLPIGDRGKHVPAFALSPDGKQIAFSANDGDLYLLELESKKVTRLTETPAYEKRLSFSTDGKSLLYVSEQADDKFSSRVFSMQIDSRVVTQLTKDQSICDNNPHYSRDGQRIVFARASRNNGDPYVRDLWNDYDLYIMNADGSSQKRITNGLYQRELDGRFSADGANLIFKGEAPGSGIIKPQILQIKADGSDNEPSVIVQNETGYGSPDVSPDGNSILFPAGNNVTLFNLPTKVSKKLIFKKPTGNGLSLQDPVFTPDGKRAIVLVSNFISAGKSDYSLWSIDIDGENEKEIAGAGLFASPLEWKPKY